MTSWRLFDWHSYFTALQHEHARATDRHVENDTDPNLIVGDSCDECGTQLWSVRIGAPCPSCGSYARSCSRGPGESEGRVVRLDERRQPS